MADITGSNEHDPDRPCRRAGGHERRRRDGQADGVRRRPGARAIAEGPRPRRARRGAAERLADARHERRSPHGHEGARHRPVRTPGHRPREQRERVLLGARQPDVHGRPDHDPVPAQGRCVQRCRRRWSVASGASTQDDAGRIYRNTNESALHVDFVPTAYFARNPSLLRTRGSYERLASDTNGLNTVWPVRPNPGTNRAYQTGIDRPDGSLAKFTAVCAPVVYRGDRLPADLYGNVFVAEPAANLVSRIVLERRRHVAAGAEGVRTGRVPRLHRRALPARLSVQRARRHALRRRHVSRDHRASPVAHGVPARSHPQAEARAADRLWPDLPRRPRDDAARSEKDACAGDAGAARRHAVAPERMVAGHRRSACSSSARIASGPVARRS